MKWAGVGGGRPGSGVNANSRVCRICWIPKDDQFCKDMIMLIYHINEKKFGFNLKPFDQQPESVQLTVYSGRDGEAYGRTGDEIGGYYHKHMDSFLGDPMQPNGGDMRKLSTTMALNKCIGIRRRGIQHCPFFIQETKSRSRRINFLPVIYGTRSYTDHERG